MQVAVIEYARNVLGLAGANSVEIDPETKYPVIHIMEDQKEVTHKGGTMRLGAWDCKLKPNTLAHSIYGKDMISERHRHRYELNNKYLKDLEKAGLVASGQNSKTGLVEI